MDLYWIWQICIFDVCRTDNDRLLLYRRSASYRYTFGDLCVIYMYDNLRPHIGRLYSSYRIASHPVASMTNSFYDFQFIRICAILLANTSKLSGFRTKKTNEKGRNRSSFACVIQTDQEECADINVFML